MNQKNSLGLDYCFKDLENPLDLFGDWFNEAKKTEINDPNALVIFQADHGLLKKGVVNSQEIFTLAKVPKECEDYLTRKVDNINGIRLLLSCATNQKVKLLEKKSFYQEENGSLVRIE